MGIIDGSHDRAAREKILADKIVRVDAVARCQTESIGGIPGNSYRIQRVSAEQAAGGNLRVQKRVISTARRYPFHDHTLKITIGLKNRWLAYGKVHRRTRRKRAPYRRIKRRCKPDTLIDIFTGEEARSVSLNSDLLLESGHFCRYLSLETHHNSNG